jgi:transposase, IS30 family
MRNYKQLNQAQRYQIGILNKAGKSQKEVAELLGISGATVCRELKRNRGKKATSRSRAQIKADNRRKQAAKALKMTAEVIIKIEEKIRLDWSPEQISGTLAISISHERIYQHIWADRRNGGTLYQPLGTAIRSVKSAMAQRIGEARSRTVSASTNAPRSLRKRPVSATGKSTP